MVYQCDATTCCNNLSQRLWLCCHISCQSNKCPFFWGNCDVPTNFYILSQCENWSPKDHVRAKWWNIAPPIHWLDTFCLMASWTSKMCQKIRRLNVHTSQPPYQLDITTLLKNHLTKCPHFSLQLVGHHKSVLKSCDKTSTFCSIAEVDHRRYIQ